MYKLISLSNQGPTEAFKTREACFRKAIKEGDLSEVENFISSNNEGLFTTSNVSSILIDAVKSNSEGVVKALLKGIKKKKLKVDSPLIDHLLSIAAKNKNLSMMTAILKSSTKKALTKDVSGYLASDDGDLVIPNGFSSIAKDLFYKDTSIRSIVIQGNTIKSINQRAFSNCTNLSEVTLSSGLKTIGRDAFEGCVNLEKVIGLESVNEIDSNAFADCSRLSHIKLSENLHKLGVGAFFKCESLTAVTIPESLTEIESSSFRECTHLTVVTFPKSISKIDGYAFSGSSRLKVLCFSGKPKIEWGAFKGCPIEKVLFKDGVPKNFLRYNSANKVYIGKEISSDAEVKALLGDSLVEVRKPRIDYWHETMHDFCHITAKDVVLAMLIVENRIDTQIENNSTQLPSLPHDIWLLMLTFAKRSELGQ